MPAPVRLIVNPSAGGGKAGAVAPDVERALRGLGLEVRRVDTRDLDHARELAREGARAGETVVALSGDGMVGAVADVLRDFPGAVLGMLPGGRGNDLARVLGIPEDPIAACAVIAAGLPRARPRLGDEARTSDRRSSGSPRSASTATPTGSPTKRPRGSADWCTPTEPCGRSSSWRPARFEIELDPPGERLSFTAYTVGAANSKCYGGGMRAAPDALLDDGLLEVVVLESVSKLAFLTKLIPKVFNGEHVKLPGVHVFRAAEVAISCDRPFTMYADGDPIGELPVRVSALQGAVTVLVPADVAAASSHSPRLALTRSQRLAGAPAPRRASRQSADGGRSRRSWPSREPSARSRAGAAAAPRARRARS